MAERELPPFRIPSSLRIEYSVVKDQQATPMMRVACYELSLEDEVGGGKEMIRVGLRG